jgi:hypothetical protein
MPSNTIIKGLLSEPRQFLVAGNATSVTPIPQFDGSEDCEINVKVTAIQNISTSLTTYGGVQTLSFNSAISANKIFNAVYNDYAECFDIKSNKNKDYDFYKNKIVEIDKNGYVKIASSKSTRVVGIVSDSYAFLLNGTDEDISNGNKVPVGMSGTVWVKANEDVSEDNLGKLVYSDDDGYALSIDPSSVDKLDGTIVGKIIDIDTENNKYKIVIMLS